MTDTLSLDKAYHAGNDARWQYYGLSSCPHALYTAESYAWIAGWKHADVVIKGLSSA